MLLERAHPLLDKQQAVWDGGAPSALGWQHCSPLRCFDLILRSMRGGAPILIRHRISRDLDIAAFVGHGNIACI